MFLPVIVILIFFSILMRKLIYRGFDFVKVFEDKRPLQTETLNTAITAADPHQSDAITITQTNPMAVP